MRVELDDPERPDVYALLEEHLRNMYELSPPESVHALDVSRLKGPDITFWSVRDGDTLLGCGALKEIDPAHGEVKSMRTPQALRRRGAGRAVLIHILGEARRRRLQAAQPRNRLDGCLSAGPKVIRELRLHLLRAIR